MRRGTWLVCGLLVVCGLGWPWGVYAEDVIYRTDGARLRGQITGETPRHVTIETVGGTFRVPRTEIARIEREGDVFREFEERREGVDRYDVEGWYELGVWCQEQELYTHAIDCFHEVLRLDPDHGDARFELGYRRLDGGWVTEQEYYEARGYERWQGRWVTAEDYEKLEQGLVYVDGHWVPASSLEEEGERPRLAGLEHDVARHPHALGDRQLQRGGAGDQDPATSSPSAANSIPSPINMTGMSSRTT